MLVVDLKYLKSLDEVGQYLAKHREFLQECYEQGFFLASGPKEPREGGVIVALVNREKMEELILQDPFYIHQIAEYQITDFDPVLSCQEIKSLL